jgi:hypothetical protein
MIAEVAMDIIQFNAIVDQDQVIRLPKGVVLPHGEIEVTIRPRAGDAAPGEDLASTRNWLLGLAEDAEQANPDLPNDLAASHEYYAHGKPRS